LDNLTHTLAGLVVAETWIALSPQRAALAGRTRRLFLGASVVANNLPDADFLYTHITPGKFGYLLHHRGHTHTLALGLALGLATYFLFARWLARRPPESEALRRIERLGLLVLSLGGPLLHIALDATNNYGVHPLWPANTSWFYGDSVFIIEPWLWVAALPPLMVSARSRIGRYTALALLLTGLALTSRFPNPVGFIVSLVLGAAGWSVLAARLNERPRWLAAVGSWLGVTLVFALAAELARRTVTESLGEGRGALVDLVTTPIPANPLCVSAITLEVSGDRYRASLAQVSLAPGLVPPESCPRERGARTARLELVSNTASPPGLLWYGRWEGSRRELAKLAERCDVAAFLRFARIPFWLRLDSGALVVGDLRFDRSTQIEFAEMELPAKVGACPPNVPPWQPPREALVQAGAIAGDGDGR
jgi:inner membrane protein